MTEPKAVSKIVVKCANPKCKRFVCKVEVFCKEVGNVATVKSVKCYHCKHYVDFAISGVKE